MIDANVALRKAYWQRLNTLVTGVPAYDNVPESAPDNYMFLSSDTAIDWSTKTEFGQDVTQEIQVITHEDGSKHYCAEIVGRVVESIRGNPLTVEGYNNMVTVLELRQVFDGDYDNEGKITRGIVRFRHLLAQN